MLADDGDLSKDGFEGHNNAGLGDVLEIAGHLVSVGSVALADKPGVLSERIVTRISQKLGVLSAFATLLQNFLLTKRAMHFSSD